ncbi:MAG: hypothetical protein AAF604_04570 [Acidobacteriota bacterium]
MKEKQVLSRPWGTHRPGLEITADPDVALTKIKRLPRQGVLLVDPKCFEALVEAGYLETPERKEQ